MARVLPYPWSLLASRADIGASFSLEDCEAVESLNPESLTFFTRAEDELLPMFAGQRYSAAPLANHVLLHLNTPAGRRPGVLSTPAFPHDKAALWHVRFGRDEFAIPVHGTLRRASAWEDPADSNAAEVSLRDTVDFLCGYFTEAVALTQDGEFPEFREFAGQAVARLDWATIWKHWKKVEYWRTAAHGPRGRNCLRASYSHSERL